MHPNKRQRFKSNQHRIVIKTWISFLFHNLLTLCFALVLDPVFLVAFPFRYISQTIVPPCHFPSLYQLRIKLQRREGNPWNQKIMQIMYLKWSCWTFLCLTISASINYFYSKNTLIRRHIGKVNDCCCCSCCYLIRGADINSVFYQADYLS